MMTLLSKDSMTINALADNFDMSGLPFLST